MKATLLFRRKFSLTTSNNRQVIFFMDLYRLPINDEREPNFRFSWIAFDSEDPTERILMDCHEPKGPHFHLNGDLEGTPFPWAGIEQAQTVFFKLVAEHFGNFQE